MRTEDILAPLPGITTLKTYVTVTGSCLVQCSDKQYCSSVYIRGVQTPARGPTVAIHF